MGASRVLTGLDLPAMEALAAGFAARAAPGQAFLLEGVLGAGKSAFARAFLRALANDPTLDVPSPTYTLVQAYELPICVVTHFDLWRLDGPRGLMELGWDQALDGIVLVEWPDRLGDLWPPHAVIITIKPGIDERRDVTIAGGRESS
ncbi:MAG: tRNA (adenosine(37)-N6)-threonylcarbamoyltransferase complex ATPase subunit type 1 TsaE [Rhodospirillales bacterium 20-60-12]|nr:MAG: tRNA (adenosine(37)-N6)-threonylcarbamoyltransferase complex ATPase subunit type 1 TsaE [Rhodospirillales bacterium 20-60-12]